MRILIVFLLFFLGIPALAHEDDIWRGFEEFKAALQQQGQLASAPELKNRSSVNELEFKVFISTSMPLESIRQYFKDSGKYQTVLVLKGLPEGSFMKLQQFVQGLTDKGEGNLILDEEAFQRFNVQMVPTIVLSSKGKIDRISGNISLPYAIAQFAKGGELKQAAQKIIQEAQ